MPDKKRPGSSSQSADIGQIIPKLPESVKNKVIMAGEHPPNEHPRFRTKLCRHWEMGRCVFGNNCAFAHGDDDIHRVMASTLNTSGENRSVKPPSKMDSSRPSSNEESHHHYHLQRTHLSSLKTSPRPSIITKQSFTSSTTMDNNSINNDEINLNKNHAMDGNAPLFPTGTSQLLMQNRLYGGTGGTCLSSSISPALIPSPNFPQTGASPNNSKHNARNGNRVSHQSNQKFSYSDLGKQPPIGSPTSSSFLDSILFAVQQGALPSPQSPLQRALFCADPCSPILPNSTYFPFAPTAAQQNNLPYGLSFGADQNSLTNINQTTNSSNNPIGSIALNNISQSASNASSNIRNMNSLLSNSNIVMNGTNCPPVSGMTSFPPSMGNYYHPSFVPPSPTGTANASVFAGFAPSGNMTNQIAAAAAMGWLNNNNNIMNNNAMNNNSMIQNNSLGMFANSGAPNLMGHHVTNQNAAAAALNSNFLLNAGIRLGRHTMPDAFFNLMQQQQQQYLQQNGGTKNQILFEQLQEQVENDINNSLNMTLDKNGTHLSDPDVRLCSSDVNKKLQVEHEQSKSEKRTKSTGDDLNKLINHRKDEDEKIPQSQVNALQNYFQQQQFLLQDFKNNNTYSNKIGFPSNTNRMSILPNINDSDRPYNLNCSSVRNTNENINDTNITDSPNNTFNILYSGGNRGMLMNNNRWVGNFIQQQGYQQPSEGLFCPSPVTPLFSQLNSDNINTEHNKEECYDGGISDKPSNN